MYDDAGAAVRHRPWLSLLAFAFVALQVTLGVRSCVREDARLGWGMFSYQTNYSVAYEWVLRDGSTLTIPDTAPQGRRCTVQGGRSAQTGGSARDVGLR